MNNLQPKPSEEKIVSSATETEETVKSQILKSETILPKIEKTSKYNNPPNKYRWWDIVDEMPEGWIIDKYCSSPLHRTVFITNGKNILTGQQKRALLRI